MNRRVNRRYQTPLPPDFVHFLVEEQGLSERQKAVVYQLRNKMQDSEWHYQDAKMSKDEFEETVNATQTQNILSSLGRYVTNPPCYGGYGNFYGCHGATLQ